MPARTINNERDIGALQATVAMLAQTIEKQGEQHSQAITQFQSMVKEAHTEIAALRHEISEMKTIISEAKGGWKVLIGIGAISAAAGAVLGKIGALIFGLPFPR